VTTTADATLQALTVAIAARVPVLMWGAPGTGKTSVVRELASRAGMHCETVLASIREPSDFSGLPVVRPDGTVSFAPPSWAQRLVEHSGGLLFLDELSTAPPAVQAALLRVVLDRTVGDLELPASTAIVAAANPPEQAAGGWDLSAPLANRFLHLEWTTDGRTVAHGLAHGFSVPVVPEPPTHATTTSTWSSLIPAFLTARPHLHLVAPTDIEQSGRAWPSPRSWHMAMRLGQLAELMGMDRSVVHQLLMGSVGTAATVELLTWVDSFDLPDPEDVLAKPTTHPLPGRADQVHAVLMAIVASLRHRNSAERWHAAWQVADRVANDHAPDIAATTAIELARLQPRGAAPSPSARQFVPLLREAGVL